jgi:single-strand DNA-binding protein
MLNRVMLIGHLGRDPEVRRLEGGQAVGKFSVATNESYQDKSGSWQTLTEWHEVVVWRQLAERAEMQLKKGMQVYIEGKLSTRSWQDAEGNQRRTTEVVANTFRVLGRKEDGTREGQPADNPTSFPSSPSNPINNHPTDSPNYSSTAPDDDLPF